MMSEPQEQHVWLHKLVGEWTYETEADPGDTTEKCGGTEVVRSLGGLWVIGEGQGQMPGGQPANTVLTLGYDPQRKRYTGTWIGSMMANLWVYDGYLDEGGKVLTLESEGPDFNGSGALAKYRDIIEWMSDDHRKLSGQVQSADGNWTTFMITHYHRR